MRVRYPAFLLTIIILCGLGHAALPDTLQGRLSGDGVPAQGQVEEQSGETGVVYGPALPQADTAGQVKLKVLDSLIFEGLSIHNPGDIRKGLEIREGKELNAMDVQESIKRLFSQGLFKSIDIFIVSETDSAVVLKVKVEEYPICENVEYSGNRKLKLKDFEEKITLKRGQIVTDDIRYDYENKIKEMYADKGYNLAEVKTEYVQTKIPGNVIVKFDISEGPRVRISSIVFKGNKEVKTARIERKFKTKENRWWRSGEFNRELYREHLDTVIFFYNDLGYLDASIVKDSVWYAENKKDINIEITIEEGKKYYAGDFFFSGNRVLETDSLKSKISLKAGKPFEKSRYELSKYMVENAYREEGYLWVRVDEKRSFRGDTIDVNFNIFEGNPAIVRKIEIKGNNKTLEKVIRREIELYPGKKYKQSLMMRSRQKIFALNYFSDIKPDLLQNDDNTIDLVFEVVEKDNIGQLQIGAAYSGESEFVGTFSTSIPNFRGAGQKLEVNLEIGQDRRRVNFGFTEPWAFDVPMSLFGNVFYERSVLDDGYNYDDTIQRVGYIVGAGRSKLKWPDDHFKISGTHQLSYEKTSAASDTIASSNLIVMQKGYLNELSLAIERYDLDMPLFPKSGDRLSIVPSVAWGPTNKFFSYFKGTASYEHYLSLPAKFVLGSRSKFGLITGLGNDIKISYNDLFKIGGVWGDGDLRGYEDYAFGGWRNSPENGLAMFTSTLELRYPILDQQLYLGIFADVGNTWKGLSEIDLGNLYKGVGVGIRLNVPMLGIMGFDFGYGLDDPDRKWFDKKANGMEVHFLMNRGF